MLNKSRIKLGFYYALKHNFFYSLTDYNRLCLNLVLLYLKKFETFFYYNILYTYFTYAMIFYVFKILNLIKNII